MSSIQELPGLVAQLRTERCEWLGCQDEREWAADTLESLAAENERLREALEEIRDLDGEINPSNYDHDDACYLNRQFCYSYELARKALSGGAPE